MCVYSLLTLCMMCTLVITKFTTHPVLCIQMFGLGVIVYYTQTELIYKQHTLHSIDFYHISYNLFICDVDIIYTISLLIVFVQCILSFL